MQFKLLKLRDFQAHKETKIQLSPGITTIKGPTDTGKSSVIRALRWLCLNDFAGEEFIRTGAHRALVLLIVRAGSSKYKIIRSKGKGNIYKVGNEEYKSFGQGVPENVSKILQVNEINFQGQFDKPFWFDESCSEVSRQLNRVIDLSIIDTSLSNIGKEVTRANDRVSLSEERLETAKEELKVLEFVKDREQDFKILKQRFEQHEKQNNHTNKLRDLIGRADSCNYREKRERSEQLSSLSTQAGNLVGLARKAESLSNILNDFTTLSLVQTPPDFGPVQTARNLFIGFSRRHRILLEEIEEAETYLQQRKDALAEQEQAESELHKAAKGEACPLCGRSFD